MSAHAQEIDFLASVTHDLKSPLNAMLGFIELLKMDISSGAADRETVLHHLATAEEVGHDMLKLINNMLTSARIQAGRETAYPFLLMHSELAGSLRSIEHTFHNEARAKNVVFSITMGRLPKYVYWDLQKIRFFAINNLVSNALKFVGHGGEVRVTAEDDGSGNVLIQVADNGPGIPEAERKVIFGKYVQASNNPRNFQGNGFGLYNANQTIIMHHGHIEVTDGLNGRGVGFRMKIPAVPFELDEFSRFALGEMRTATAR